MQPTKVEKLCYLCIMYQHKRRHNHRGKRGVGMYFRPKKKKNYLHHIGTYLKNNLCNFLYI